MKSRVDGKVRYKYFEMEIKKKKELVEKEKKGVKPQEKEIVK